MLWFTFTVIERDIEVIIYGEPFTHWLDVVIGVAVLAYSVYTVRVCGEVNGNK